MSYLLLWYGPLFTVFVSSIAIEGHPRWKIQGSQKGVWSECFWWKNVRRISIRPWQQAYSCSVTDRNPKYDTTIRWVLEQHFFFIFFILLRLIFYPLSSHQIWVFLTSPLPRPLLFLFSFLPCSFAESSKGVDVHASPWHSSFKLLFSHIPVLFQELGLWNTPSPRDPQVSMWRQVTTIVSIAFFPSYSLLFMHVIQCI